MIRSPEINEIAQALAAAQAEMSAATRDSTNPHFGNSYASLTALMAAARPHLTKHNICIVQSPRLVHAGDEWLVEVETSLFHASGQFLADTVAVPVPQINAQTLGSAVTYLKRYALSAFTSIAPAGDDDDGELAVVAAARKRAPPARETANAARKNAPAKPSAPAATEVITAKVINIVKRPLANGREKFLVSCDDEQVYSTFSVSAATEAKAAREAGRPISIRYKPTQFGRDIVELREAPEPPL